MHLSNVSNLIDNVLNMVEKQYRKEKIEVVRMIDPNIPHVMMDARQMEQVIINITNNAVFAMKEAAGATEQLGVHRKGMLTVGARFHPDKECIEIFIKDTGVGISKNALKKIFDPFFTTRKDGKGTGLGLSGCYHNIVNRFLMLRNIIIQETKNGKPRTIPLNQIALNILIEKAKVRNLKSDLVFLSTAMTKINCHNLIRAFKIALEKAGIQGFHFHDLRHTFATRLAQRGVDLYKISKLLGHYDISMTQRYAHHCPESLRDGIQVLEVGHNLVTVGENRNVSSA